MYTCFVSYSPSYSLFQPPPHSHWYLPSGQELINLPILWFCRRKKKNILKWRFSLFQIKVVTQGVSLWYFHEYMYCNPNSFISL
jgi:hypothetical protein